jgi:hypothetical protein
MRGRYELSKPIGAISREVLNRTSRKVGFEFAARARRGSDEPAGRGLPGEIILFVDDGRLSYMEYVYYDALPTEWPSLDRISVSVQPR